jgi:hypothetical protein
MTGWVGYTLSWTWRKFEQLNEGAVIRPVMTGDMIFQLLVIMMQGKNGSWGLYLCMEPAMQSLYRRRFYIINGVLTQEYSNLNQYRMKAYHRMDFSATYTPVPKKKRNSPVHGYSAFIMSTAG